MTAVVLSALFGCLVETRLKVYPLAQLDLHQRFSALSQVSSFLATLSSHHVTVNHLPGVSNLSSDYASRNPVQCENQGCHICKFVQSTAQSVVNRVEVKEILSGNETYVIC